MPSLINIAWVVVVWGGGNKKLKIGCLSRLGGRKNYVVDREHQAEGGKFSWNPGHPKFHGPSGRDSQQLQAMSEVGRGIHGRGGNQDKGDR